MGLFLDVGQRELLVDSTRLLVQDSSFRDFFFFFFRRLVGERELLVATTRRDGTPICVT